MSLSDAVIPSAAVQHIGRAAELVELEGAVALDIGCGSGEFLRLLLERGADARGLEVAPEPIAKAVAAGTDPSRLVLGDGRTLPFRDGFFDLLFLINSFHHVPARTRLDLLAESARILKSGGTLIAVEPRPFGEMTEVIRPLEDETEVRTAAQSLLASPPAPFHLRRIEEYDSLRAFPDAGAMIRGLVAVDPDRAARAADPAIREAVEQGFASKGVKTATGRMLTQPTALFVLDRP